MYIFEVIKDTYKPTHAGAEGMYQIEKLILNNKDVTNKIDQGMMFNDEDELANDLTEYLSQAFSIPKSKIKYKSNDINDHPDWPFK